MVSDQLIDSRVQAAERQAVGGQDQAVLWQFPETRQGVEELGQRISLRLRWPHADVGRDLGQHLVAGDQHVVLRAEQAEHLRRVAASDEHPPLCVGEAQPLALSDTAERRWRRRDTAAVQITAGGALLDQLMVKSCAVVEAAPGRDPLVTGVLRKQARSQPLGPAGPELGSGLGAQPARQAHVVRVVMRGDNARDRFTREQALPQPLPTLARLLIGQTGVDHGPPTISLGEPDVDMVQSKREGEAYPVQPRPDRARLAVA